MSRLEVMKLVNQYIGVTGGYLGDFSYNTHANFYPDYCGLNYDPYKLTGTTRERFLAIITQAPPDHQAKIVRGILAKYPPADDGSMPRTKELHDEFLALAVRLEKMPGVAWPNPKITSEAVERAIADAEALLGTQGATSGVDRLHTALHGYLKAVCDAAGLTFSADATMTNLFKLIREQHSAFQNLGPRAEDITRVIYAMATIMDAMNPVRNRASMAHPNKELLDSPEAMLVINAARTILHYLDAKIA